jgi:hypothetical protein
MLRAQGLAAYARSSFRIPHFVISSEARNPLFAGAGKQQVPFDFAQGRLSSHSLLGMTGYGGIHEL